MSDHKRAASHTADELSRWVEEQYALAGALGLSIEDWVEALELASCRRTELLAAVVGAASAKKKGLGILRRVNSERLARRARELLLSDDGSDISQMLVKTRSEVSSPRRGGKALGPSSGAATADAPGSRGEN